ncbi:hypothetical protein K7H91_11800 [Martelella mediterranea]|uniref:hypothetical protein n=1 Tax=Martelella mediterranea TaxID=293089 RepID=UPI001E3E8D87|nr:hypothetical protein [Martelella mediterranea]MCD1634455.1 hypothetical protein [Martelella mediterranea]
MTNATIAWSDLLDVYLNTVWDDGEEGNISIATPSILETLQRIENSDKAAETADIAILGSMEQAALGKAIRARIGYPQYKLGILTENWDGFLNAPQRRVEAPSNFFIKSDKSHSSQLPTSVPLEKYRAILRFVCILRKAALFTDVSHALLVYFGDRRIEVPINYCFNDFQYVDETKIDDLSATLEGDLHREQRLSILGESIKTLVAGQLENGRFIYLLQNADELKKRVEEGYKLFASSFSYSKVRGEIEKSQAEYIARVHKTFTDIQGQLLGLPVSAIIIATQLKSTKTCGPEAIANIAILGGAFLFVALLIASCWNQMLTLDAISREIKDQRKRLNSDFSEISGMFNSAFDAINARICWHRGVLLAISLLALAGAWFTWRGYSMTTELNAWGCLFGGPAPPG